MAEGSVGQIRKLVPKSGFRLEIEGRDLRCESVAAFEVEFSIISIEEGGAETTVDHFVNKFKYSTIEFVRQTDVDDDFCQDWATSKAEKNGVLYYMRAGKDVAKRVVRRCLVMKYSDFDGDAKSEDEDMKEKVTLKFLEVGRREKVV